LVLMVLFSPYAGKIPMATLAAILMYVAYNMAEIEHFRTILNGPKSEALILLTTFSLTVFIDLTVAVQVGVLIAAFMFLKNMTEKTQIKLVRLLKKEEQAVEHEHSEPEHPQDVEIFELEGPFFFGVSDILNEALRQLATTPSVFILRMPTVPYIDSSGMQALKLFHKKCEKHHIVFLISEVRREVFHVLEESEVFLVLRKEQFFPSLREALEKAKHHSKGA
jgi:sulfate permease, SulP family